MLKNIYKTRPPFSCPRNHRIQIESVVKMGQTDLKNGTDIDRYFIRSKVFYAGLADPPTVIGYWLLAIGYWLLQKPQRPLLHAVKGFLQQL